MQNVRVLNLISKNGASQASNREERTRRLQNKRSLDRLDTECRSIPVYLLDDVWADLGPLDRLGAETFGNRAL